MERYFQALMIVDFYGMAPSRRDESIGDKGEDKRSLQFHTTNFVQNQHLQFHMVWAAVFTYSISFSNSTICGHI